VHATSRFWERISAKQGPCRRPLVAKAVPFDPPRPNWSIRAQGPRSTCPLSPFRRTSQDFWSPVESCELLLKSCELRTNRFALFSSSDEQLLLTTFVFYDIQYISQPWLDPIQPFLMLLATVKVTPLQLQLCRRLAAFLQSPRTSSTCWDPTTMSNLTNFCALERSGLFNSSLD